MGQIGAPKKIIEVEEAPAVPDHVPAEAPAAPAEPEKVPA